MFCLFCGICYFVIFIVSVVLSFLCFYCAVLSAVSLRRINLSNKTFVTMGVNGEFLHLAVFEPYLSNACTDPHQILFV